MKTIYSYTRQMAIDDGILIDVTKDANEAGIRIHTVLTCGAWDEVVKVPNGCEGHQDKDGRLWDVLMMARGIMASRRRENTARFKVQVITEPGRSEVKTLIAHVGPGDKEEPVLTIMLPGEN